MEMLIDFPGGDRVDAHFGPFTVVTDQPAMGYIPADPTPYSVFLASIGTCAGIYVLGFCKQRGIPSEGIHIVEKISTNPANGLADHIDLEIQVPPEFPEKYYDALIRAADQCKVKKQLAQPPDFNVYTRVVQ